MTSAGLTSLVDALEALGLAVGVAQELADRGRLEFGMGRLRQVVREELERAGSPWGANPEGFMTVKQAAEHAGVKPATLREWLTAGKLRGAKAGNRWRVAREDLVAFLRSQGAGAGEVVDLDAEASRLLSLDHARDKRR